MELSDLIENNDIKGIIKYAARLSAELVDLREELRETLFSATDNRITEIFKEMNYREIHLALALISLRAKPPQTDP